MEKTLHTFTDDQIKSIEEIDNNLLIISGPGTGKTSIIARKVSYLLEMGYNTNEILITTFTNKATDELKLRIAHYCEPNGILPHHLQVYTIHGFCRKIAKEFSYILSPKKDFTLLDEYDQKLLLLHYYQELGFSKDLFVNDKIFFGTIFHLIGLYNAFNENLIDLKDIKNYINEKGDKSVTFNKLFDKGVFLRDKDIYNIFNKYRKFMWNNKWLDHSQALKLTYTLLKEYNNIRNALQERYKYVLVDEYQDTSYLQHEIFKLLVGDKNKICAVGDDDQGIYQFRGASVHNLFQFERDFLNVKTYKIGDNFRSTENIVQFSQHVISDTKNRFNKKLSSMRGFGSDVKLIEGETPKETAKLICYVIKKLIEKQVVASYSEIALLFRSVRWNFIGPGYKDVFDEEGIPCIIHRSGNYFNHKDVSIMLDFLRLLTHSNDFRFESFIPILEQLNLSNTTFNSFLEQFKPYFTFEEFSPENLINKHNISNTLDLEKLNNIYQLYSSVKEANTHNILNILFEVLKITDFINRALVQNNQNSLCQVAYLTELAKSFENCGGETLNSFVESLLIFKDKRTLEEIPDEDILDGVNISTIHNVKGLQYNTVFICDFDPSNQWDGNFHVPNSLLKFKKSPTEDHDNQLRLFYVALTRAKDNLFLTYSKTNQYGYAVKSKSFLEKAIMDSKITMFDQKEINLLIDKKSNSTQDNWIPSNSISLSFSGINSYLTCPLKYQLEYIYKFNTPSNKNAIFGSIIHKALEKIHSALFHNQIIDEEYIIDILAAHANIYKFNNTDELEDTKNRAISILKNYFHSHLPKASCIYLVEEDFEVFWDYEGKYRLIGSFDLVTKSESGAIEIVDFKTGIIDESTENQLLTYALAYELENSLKVSSIKTHYLIDNNIINYTITPEKLDQTKSMINNVFNKVNHKDFYATPSDKNCCHCTFNRCCSFSCYD